MDGGHGLSNLNFYHHFILFLCTWKDDDDDYDDDDDEDDDGHDHDNEKC